VITGKFVDAVPFYRQEKQFGRLGVELTRATMCGWALQVAERCRPMIELLREEILSGPLIQADETTVQVLEEPGREAQADSYMWVFRGGPPGRPGLLYQYAPTRAGRVAADFLNGYTGYVQTDGYAGYDFLDGKPGVIHAGCWAHARRKFDELKKAISGKARTGPPRAGSADVALAYIRELYAIEHRAHTSNLAGDELVRVRKKEAGEVLEKFKKWLEQKYPQTPPQGLLGKAIGYTLGQWNRLIVYLESPFLTPDNNLTENAIRPFVIGRNNWIFSGTPEGAGASATLYSLIETAKANGLEPYRYLRYLFARLPHANSQDDYRTILPQHTSLLDILQDT
jgi:transposase